MQKPADPIPEPPDLSLSKGLKVPIREVALFLLENPRRRVVIGQQRIGYAYHTKKKSLDYWLRTAAREQKRDPGTMRANRSVIDQLVAMPLPLFERLDEITCPESGELCGGIGLTKLGIEFAKQFQKGRAEASNKGGTL